MHLKKLFVIMFVSVVFAGCDAQDEYATEREYYRVQKQAGRIMANPDATPPMELKRTVDALESFAVKHPNTNVAVDAQFTVARLYVAVKDHPKAHEELIKIDTAYARVGAISAEAAYMRALAYEDEGDWGSALKQYQVLIKSYPRTPRGLEAPLRIAMRYKSKFQPDKMMSALREALTHYQNLALQDPGTPLALQARVLIAQSYSELNEWKDAVNTLESIVKDFKGKVRTDQFMLDIAGIYTKHLKDPDAARVVLNKVIQDSSEKRAKEAAQTMLTQLEKDSQ